MKFVAIRKSHIFGRIWEEGDVIELKDCPSKHFVPADDNGKPATEEVKKAVLRDPMKPESVGNSGEPTSFSALSQIPQAQGGFASSLNKPLRTRPKRA